VESATTTATRSTQTRSTQTRRTQVERSTLSDARMLEAAVRLICTRGTAGTTLKDVGVSAGYSRGLAGNRFGSKARLWSFIVRSIGEEWLLELGRAVQDQVGVAAIHAAVDAHSRFLLDSSERIRAFYILWFDSAGPNVELQRVIAHVHERRQSDVERWILDGIAAGEVRRDVNVRGVAEQFCAAIIGIVYQWLVTPLAHDRIDDLHAGLKQQMTQALSVSQEEVAA
jgi:AcrR family transcriptional regulator